MMITMIRTSKRRSGSQGMSSCGSVDVAASSSPGRVKWFDHTRGFGFIEARLPAGASPEPQQQQWFLHSTNVTGPTSCLAKGSWVVFREGRGKGDRAEAFDVRIDACQELELDHAGGNRPLLPSFPSFRPSVLHIVLFLPILPSFLPCFHIVRPSFRPSFV